MLSIIIPARREPLLQKTIDSLVENATGEIEVVPVLDGWETPIKPHPMVKPIKLLRKKGMRGAINTGIDMSKGEYFMKLDAHCLFAPGFDIEMTQKCADNWVVVPRRYSLNAEDWCRDLSRPIRDSHYLSFPEGNRYGYHMAAGSHKDWDAKVGNGDVIDTMTFQGSCYMVNRKYFKEVMPLGYLDNRPETYGDFSCEELEIAMNYWLGGGEAKTITSTWYAHLSKRAHHYRSGEYSRSHKKLEEVIRSNNWATKYWIENKKFAELIEKFWPIPGWPNNWREVWESYEI